jgi:hypothetical protein
MKILEWLCDALAALLADLFDGETVPSWRLRIEVRRLRRSVIVSGHAAAHVARQRRRLAAELSACEADLRGWARQDGETASRHRRIHEAAAADLRRALTDLTDSHQALYCELDRLRVCLKSAEQDLALLATLKRVERLRQYLDRHPPPDGLTEPENVAAALDRLLARIERMEAESGTGPKEP